MHVKTTYSLTEEVIEMLREAEKKTGRDAIELIIRAVGALIHDHKLIRKEIGTVEYQKRFDEETGEPVVKHRVKVKMMDVENLMLQDMRRFCLKSISFLIAIAVKAYLEKIVAYLCAKFIENIGDSYPAGNWTYKEKHTEFATCTIVWWGVPPNYVEEFFG